MAVYSKIGADGIVLEETTYTSGKRGEEIAKTVETRWSKDRKVRYRCSGNIIELSRRAVGRTSRPAFPCKVLEFRHRRGPSAGV